MLDLHDLKSVGYHMLRSAKKGGNSPNGPLAFMGFVTVAIGAKFLWDAFKGTEGPDERSR